MLKEKLCEGCKAEETIHIWNGISGYFQYPEEIINSISVFSDNFREAYFGDKFR